MITLSCICDDNLDNYHCDIIMMIEMSTQGRMTLVKSQIRSRVPLLKLCTVQARVWTDCIQKGLNQPDLIIWYVPYDTIWYHMIPYDNICMIPYKTIWYHMIPYEIIWYHMKPYDTIWYHMIPSKSGPTTIVINIVLIFIIISMVIMMISTGRTPRPRSSSPRCGRPRPPPHPPAGLLLPPDPGIKMKMYSKSVLKLETAKHWRRLSI